MSKKIILPDSYYFTAAEVDGHDLVNYLNAQLAHRYAFHHVDKVSNTMMLIFLVDKEADPAFRTTDSEALLQVQWHDNFSVKVVGDLILSEGVTSVVVHGEDSIEVISGNQKGRKEVV